MDDIYKTVNEVSSGIYKEKGSKFLSFLHPVSNIEQVKDIVSRVRNDYFDARHVCYAYRIGKDGQLWRMVDDGEPSSTGGKPILGQLLSNDISNVVGIVVRYFGGTKLGISGLINAYKCATADAILNATIIEQTVKVNISLSFDYTETTSVMQLVRNFGGKIIEQNYDNKSDIKIVLREGLVISFCDQLGSKIHCEIEKLK